MYIVEDRVLTEPPPLPNTHNIQINGILLKDHSAHACLSLLHALGSIPNPAKSFIDNLLDAIMYRSIKTPLAYFWDNRYYVISIATPYIHIQQQGQHYYHSNDMMTSPLSSSKSLSSISSISSSSSSTISPVSESSPDMGKKRNPIHDDDKPNLFNVNTNKNQIHYNKSNEKNLSGIGGMATTHQEINELKTHLAELELNLITKKMYGKNEIRVESMNHTPWICQKGTFCTSCHGIIDHQFEHCDYCGNPNTSSSTSTTTLNDSSSSSSEMYHSSHGLLSPPLNDHEYGFLSKHHAPLLR